MMDRKKSAFKRQGENWLNENTCYILLEAMKLFSISKTALSLINIGFSQERLINNNIMEGDFI
jgi:hypothetical protein